MVNIESKNESETTLAGRQRAALAGGCHPWQVCVGCSHERSLCLEDSIEVFYKHTSYVILLDTVSASEVSFISYILGI